MPNSFFECLIFNPPYEYPSRHWELDETEQPTQQSIESRRKVSFITPSPKPKKQGGQKQYSLGIDEGKGLSTGGQRYDATSTINEIRNQVDIWRKLPSPSQWQVTPATARLLQHWNLHQFSHIHPFFCQAKAAETAIWLAEEAPNTPYGRSSSSTSKKPASHPIPICCALHSSLRLGQARHHAHCLADAERHSPPRQQKNNAWSACCCPKANHLASPTGDAAERPGQLLPQSRACARLTCSLV